MDEATSEHEKERRRVCCERRSSEVFFLSIVRRAIGWLLKLHALLSHSRCLCVCCEDWLKQLALVLLPPHATDAALVSHRLHFFHSFLLLLLLLLLFLFLWQPLEKNGKTFFHCISQQVQTINAVNSERKRRSKRRIKWSVMLFIEQFNRHSSSSSFFSRFLLLSVGKTCPTNTNSLLLSIAARHQKLQLVGQVESI